MSKVRYVYNIQQEWYRGRDAETILLKYWRASVMEPLPTGTRLERMTKMAAAVKRGKLFVYREPRRVAHRNSRYQGQLVMYGMAGPIPRRRATRPTARTTRRPDRPRAIDIEVVEAVEARLRAQRGAIPMYDETVQAIQQIVPRELGYWATQYLNRPTGGTNGQ